jgi:rubrerythrin
MSKTHEALMEAFSGESQANRKYSSFAAKAEQEGYPQIAKLFRAVAHAETIHAANHLKIAGGIGNTAENLQEAVDGENYEVESMYPPMMATAEEEDEKRAHTSFRWAWEVEKVHAVLYQAALDLLKSGQAVEEEAYDYYVCPVCGHTHPRNAPDKCPVCGAPGTRFERVS